MPAEQLIPTTLKVLFTEEQIQQRISEMAEEINMAYADCPEITIISILKGSFMFTADLARQLKPPCKIEFVRLSSYEGQKSSGTVKPMDLSLPKLSNKDILLVEDIVDTGLTLNFFMEYLKSLHEPNSLRLAVLLNKSAARQQPVDMDFVGFEIDDKYVVGYGLDDDGLYRNLPYIAYYP